MTTKTSILLSTLWILLALAASSCKDDVSDEDVNDSDSDTSHVPADTGTGTPQDTGTVTPQDTGTDVPQDTNTSTPEDTGTGTPEDTGTGEPIDTGVDTGDGAPLRIEAECAIGVEADTGNDPDDEFENFGSTDTEPVVNSCATYPGSNSNLEDSAGWGGAYPSLSSDGQLGYTNGGAWIAFEGINVGYYNKLVIHYASAEDAPTDTDSEGQVTTGFYVRVDGETAEAVTLCTLVTNFTGSWTDYTDASCEFITSVEGIHKVYLVAYKDGINNGNIDWIEFQN